MANPANGTNLFEIVRALAGATFDTATDSNEQLQADGVAIQTEVDKIGVIPALDGAGQTIGAAIAKLADDNGGADFDATTDSLQAIIDDISSRLPAALVGGAMDSDVSAMQAAVIAGESA